MINPNIKSFFFYTARNWLSLIQLISLLPTSPVEVLKLIELCFQCMNESSITRDHREAEIAWRFLCHKEITPSSTLRKRKWLQTEQRAFFSCIPGHIQLTRRSEDFDQNNHPTLRGEKIYLIASNHLEWPFVLLWLLLICSWFICRGLMDSSRCIFSEKRTAHTTHTAHTAIIAVTM